ncbi:MULTISPECIES: LysR family transcriptional regulator [Hyphomicrobium]|jgi:DNA-binding transcriptional LysR family regulator|uniref:LysR family transcriptional regulator n=1 Tax=Hyphomicrobium TaxID=81 RepID=UPI00037CA17F|nr:MULTISPECIES: LysR family transcriptional regulator [Hyphomicrobium]WBT37226.1 LysR family transcriptional regulator [Hyphomicrobium sp. DMF-1]
MNLQQLRYVRALAEEGSFVAAASRCAVTQPTLSNGIAQLEADLGHRIFRRTTRSVALTAYGERILPAVLDALKAFERVRDLAKQTGKAQHVSVGLSPCVGIRMAEVAFEPAKAQRADLEIVYRESNLAELCDLMRRSQIDIILSPLDTRSQALPDCMVQRIYSEPLLFIPRKEVREKWAHASHVTVREIAEEQFVLVPNACGLAQVTKRLFEDNCCTLNRYLGEASSYSVVEEWSDMGLGSGILPASKISMSSRHPAIPILDDGQPAKIDYFAVGKPNTIPTALFNEIWETLQVETVPTSHKHVPAPVSAFDWCL